MACPPFPPFRQRTPLPRPRPSLLTQHFVHAFLVPVLPTDAQRITSNCDSGRSTACPNSGRPCGTFVVSFTQSPTSRRAARERILANCTHAQAYACGERWMARVKLWYFKLLVEQVVESKAMNQIPAWFAG